MSWGAACPLACCKMRDEAVALGILALAFAKWSNHLEWIWIALRLHVTPLGCMSIMTTVGVC
jgi:hypothetical protein